MHCFTGITRFCKKSFNTEFNFSASGIITFPKNSHNLQNTFNYIPSDKLLVETDSPYLAPVPMRGNKMNLFCQTLSIKNF